MSYKPRIRKDPSLWPDGKIRHVRRPGDRPDLNAAIVQSITQPLVQQPASPALDFADIRTALVNGGRGYFGQGEAVGAPCGPAEATIADLKRAIRES